MIAIAVLVLTLLVVGPAWSTVRYVSPTGNDANSCAASESLSTPKLTLVSAKACMVGGDELIIRGGNYTGPDNHFNLGMPSGTAGAPTKYTAYSGEIPNIHPTLTASPSFVIQVSNRSYITFTGLHVNGADVKAHTVRFGENVDQVIFQDGDITDDHKGLSTASWDLGNSCVSGYAAAGQPNNVQILRNKIHDCGYNNFDHGIYPGQSTGWIIRGNEIYGNSGWGLHVYQNPDSYQIEGNYVHDNCEYDFTQPGATGNCAEVILANIGHTFAENIVVATTGHYASSGVVVQYGTNGGDNMKLYSNTIVGQKGTGTGILIYTTSNASELINNHVVGFGININNLGTNTVQLTNRSTGSNTDCNPSTTDYTQKSGSVCIDAGTVISGRQYSGPAPDIGALESIPAPTASITANVMTLIFPIGTHAPIRNLSPAGVIVNCAGSACPGSPTVNAVSQPVGTDTQVNITISGIAGNACVLANQNWTVTYTSSPGTWTDSAAIGYPPGLNQKVFSFTSLGVTNLCDGLGPSGYPAGYYLFYKFNDGSGTNANDESANNADGTLTNGPAWTGGKSGTAVAPTAGTSQYVAIPCCAGHNPSTGDMTVAFGVNVPSGQELASRGEFGVDVGVDRRLHIQGVSGTWRLGAQGSSASSGASSLPVTAGWNHLCMKVDATTNIVTLYKDGVAGTGSASKAVTSYTLASNFKLGLYDINTAPGGVYDDLLLYYSLEDCAAIYAAFQASSAPPTGTFSQAAVQAQAVYTLTAGGSPTNSASLNSAKTVVVYGGLAWVFQIYCENIADCESTAFRLAYRKNGAGVWAQVPNTETSDGVWMWGADTSTILNSGTTTTRLTGSCAVTNGATLLTSSQVPTVDLPQDGCVMLRGIVRVGNIPGQYVEFRVETEGGQAFGGSYVLGRADVLPAQASAGP